MWQGVTKRDLWECGRGLLNETCGSVVGGLLNETCGSVVGGLLNKTCKVSVHKMQAVNAELVFVCKGFY